MLIWLLIVADKTISLHVTQPLYQTSCSWLQRFPIIRVFAKRITFGQFSNVCAQKRSCFYLRFKLYHRHELTVAAFVLGHKNLAVGAPT